MGWGACSKLPYGAKQDQKPGVLGPEAVSSQQATPWRGEGEVHLPLWLELRRVMNVTDFFWGDLPVSFHYECKQTTEN